MKRVTMDFETRSVSNLQTEGAYKYSMNPTTRPTCLAFKVRGEKKIYFLDFQAVGRHWREQPENLKTLWTGFISEGAEFSAHNAFFETCIYKNVLVKRFGWPDIPFRRFRCTAAKAAACALPRNLEGAGAAMRLTTQKDKRGYAAMMATCKPTRRYNDWVKLQTETNERLDQGGVKCLAPRHRKWLEAANPCPPLFLEPEVAPDVFQTLYTYCKIDVRTEELLDEALPDLIPSEQEIWFLNQKLNWRGLPADIPTIKKIVGIMSLETKTKMKQLDTLTMGLITKPGARKSILEFLALEGIVLPDIKAKTVSDALKRENLDENMKQLLEIRQQLSKTSTKKYRAFLDRAMPDGRCRDILLYHGASTGRDTGTGLQPHNFPRGLIHVDKEHPYAAVENVIEHDADWLRFIYGDSLAILFSSILRNMIVPAAGKELFVADFSKIEVAVLWWLADNVPGLKILRAGLDPYKYMAAENTGQSYEDISDEGDERQLGKAQVLGCGFGMGWLKFLTTAYDQYRLKLTEDQAKSAVSNYRTANEAVPLLWKAYERAAIEAVKNPIHFIDAGKCRFQCSSGFLWVKLPSGRELAYRDPYLTMRQTDYGERETLEFMAVNSKTKKWGPERTWGGTLTENIVQATARDLMMPAMVRLEKADYRALLMVHDEGICEKPLGAGSVDEFVKILCEPPKWAKGLPLEAKGWKGPRYRK